MAQSALGGVVAGVDAGRLAEGPERVLLGEQAGAEARGLGVATAGALFEQSLDALAQRGELRGQPGELVPLFEVAAMGGDRLARRRQELLTEPAGGALALGDLLALADDVSPAQLLLKDVEEVVAGVAV